jgi:Zn-dependent protease with chaperone function
MADSGNVFEYETRGFIFKNALYTDPKFLSINMSLLPLTHPAIHHRRTGIAIIASLAALLIMLWTGNSVAQIGDEAEIAHLSLWMTEQNSTRITLTLGLAELPPDLPWADKMNTLAGCNLEEVRLEQDEGWLHFTGACDRPFQPEGWQQTRTFNFAPLLDQLRTLNIETLSLTLMHPRIGMAHTEPAIAPMSSGGWSWWTKDIVYSETLNVNHPAFTQLNLKLGYRQSDVIRLLALPIGLLLLTLGLVSFMRWQALRVHRQDAAPIWFGYQRSLSWLITGLWVLWALVVFSSGVGDLVDLWVGNHFPGASGLIHGFAFLFPPALVVVLCYAMSHAVFQQVGKMEWSMNDLVQQAIWSQVRTFLPLLLLLAGFGAWSSGKFQLVVVWFVAAYLTHLISTQLLLKAQDMTAHAITMGELRDRIFALAQPAGVNLRQVYVLPMKRGRMANAFAMQNGNVMLTDYLLQHLSKREVDAIMAHELAHLQYGHPKALSQVFILSIFLSVVVTALVSSIWLPWLPWLPLSILLALLVYYAYSRRFEHQADLQGVLLTGDPGAMITGLVKLAQLNLMPLQWGKVDESMLTHPSMRRRVEAIAQQYALSSAQVQDLLQTSDINVERYALPPAVTNSEPIFSSTAKQKMTLRLFWLYLLVAAVPPAMVAGLLPMTWNDGLQWLVYLGGFILTLALVLVAQNLGSVWDYPQWQRQLNRKLQSEGLPIAIEQGIFVGLSPDAQPRIYEGFYDWDVGFLWINGDRLCYIGEQTRFALRPDQMTGLALGEPAPGWWRSPRIYITWHDDTRNISGTFNLRPADVRALHYLAKASRSLKQSLQQWWENPPSQPLPQPLIDLSSPHIGTVTSILPHKAVTANQFISYVTLSGLVAVGVSILLSLSMGRLFYVLSVAIACAVFQMIPLWRSQRRG